MRLISSRPTRLFCPTCDEILNVPQGGAIKLYKGVWRVSSDDECGRDEKQGLKSAFSIFTLSAGSCA
jgi:hypothetical protein